MRQRPHTSCEWLFFGPDDWSPGLVGDERPIITTTAVGVPTADWEQRVAELVFTFRGDRDQIVVGGAAKYPTAGSTLAANSVTIRLITGGCGACAGASGYCESTRNDDGT